MEKIQFLGLSLKKYLKQPKYFNHPFSYVISLNFFWLFIEIDLLDGANFFGLYFTIFSFILFEETIFLLLCILFPKRYRNYFVWSLNLSSMRQEYLLFIYLRVSEKFIKFEVLINSYDFLFIVFNFDYLLKVERSNF